MTDPAACLRCGARGTLRECDVLDGDGLRHGWLCQRCWEPAAPPPPGAAAPPPPAALSRRPGVMQREWRDGPTYDERLVQYRNRVAACQCTACGKLGDVIMGVKQATVSCSACGCSYIVKAGSRGYREAKLRVQQAAAPGGTT